MAFRILATALLLASCVSSTITNRPDQAVLREPTTESTKMSGTVHTIYDALIIGGGPAGLSAALALARVCRSSLVFDSGDYRNRGAKAMHTFLSRDGIAPEDFRATAREQIREKYSAQVSFSSSRVQQIAKVEITPGYQGFQAVNDANQTFSARKLVFATGIEDILPTDIEGYKDNWPSHIYQCPFCDGFEQKDFPIGVFTFPDPSYAHFVLMARPFNQDITIYSNGPPPTDEPTQKALKKVLATGVKLDERKVHRFINNGEGPENGISVEFETGDPVRLGMLLHRPPTRNRGQDLFAQLGLGTKPNGDVITDPMKLGTNVPGCVAAGDTQESIKQAVMAAGNGLRAAAVIAFELADEEGNQALAALEKNEANL